MAGCWSASRCRKARCASSASSCASSATRTPTRRATRPTACSWFNSVALHLVGVADGGGEGARRAGLRLAEVGEALGVAAIDAALGDHVVHWDVPGLRVDGVEARSLVGDSDHHRPLGEGGERAVEEARAVAEAIALRVPAVHRQKYRVGLHRWRIDRVGNVQRTAREGDARMPFAKYQRRLRRNDDRQRGQRAPLAQRSGKMAGGALALYLPTKNEGATGKAREGGGQITGDAPAPEGELGGGERRARPGEARSPCPAPGFV